MNEWTTSQLCVELAELGHKIKLTRNQRNLTLQALATKADVGVQTLIRIEDGSKGTSIFVLQKVLYALGLSLSVVGDFTL